MRGRGQWRSLRQSWCNTRMTRTAAELTAQEMASYRDGLSRKPVWDRPELVEHRAKAFGVVIQAAALFKEKLGAKQVMLFGSLAHVHWFTNNSDINLTVSETSTSKFYGAMSAVENLTSEFQVDLLPLEECRPEWREIILREAKPL